MIKKLLANIDRKLFGDLIGKSRRANRDQFLDKYLQTNSKLKLTIYSEENWNPLLADLCDKYGSDKGCIDPMCKPFPWDSHSYTDLYTLLFQHRRMHVLKVFECGLGTNFSDVPSNMSKNGRPGASLRVWKDYFPSAIIIGADVDRRVLFTEERIFTYYVDQTDASTINQLWIDAGIDEFDIMIDDGLHTFEAGRCLLENSIHKLSRDGIYIIEDVSDADLIKFKKYMDDKNHNYKVVRLQRANSTSSNNNLILVECPAEL